MQIKQKNVIMIKIRSNKCPLWLTKQFMFLTYKTATGTIMYV